MGDWHHVAHVSSAVFMQSATMSPPVPLRPAPVLPTIPTNRFVKCEVRPTMAWGFLPMQLPIAARSVPARATG